MSTETEEKTTSVFLSGANDRKSTLDGIRKYYNLTNEAVDIRCKVRFQAAVSSYFSCKESSEKWISNEKLLSYFNNGFNLADRRIKQLANNPKENAEELIDLYEAKISFSNIRGELLGYKSPSCFFRFNFQGDDETVDVIGQAKAGKDFENPLGITETREHKAKEAVKLEEKAKEIERMVKGWISLPKTERIECFLRYMDFDCDAYGGCYINQTEKSEAIWKVASTDERIELHKAVQNKAEDKIRFSRERYHSYFSPAPSSSYGP